MIRRFFLDSQASAAAEFALSLPIMLALMFGSFEAGHFFWTEHKIVKAVRDGARYATRLNVYDLCTGDTETMSAATETAIQNITATGQIASGGVPKVPGWNPSSVTVTVGCEAFVDTGIYTDFAAQGPLVTVSSGSVAYPSLFVGLGFLDDTLNLAAKSSAAVTGI